MNKPSGRPPRDSGTAPRNRDFSKPVVVPAPPSEASVVRREAAAKVSPARAAAFHILSRVALSAAHSDDLLHSLAVNALSQEDRNLTTTLVLGVLRWQLHLDAVLRPMMQRPDAELHLAALLALRIGIFQLQHLDRVPPHAAINESVELARANGAAHAAGMVNAILRRFTRESPAESSRPNRLAVAMTPAETAHPEWLMTRWRTHFGGAITRKIAEYDQAEPPSHALFAVEADLPEIDDGSRLVAELAAAAVASPKRILDCCAAPGGKTAVLAVRHPQAAILATDVNEKRLSAMRKRMDREPATARVTTVLADMTALPGHAELQERFDLILCDAPCSGTGTLARNPEIRHRLRGSDLPRQVERQRAILTNALSMLAAGGRLIYSTCSLEPEENEGVVDAVLKSAPEMRLVSASSVFEHIAGLSSTSLEAFNKAESDSLRTFPGVHPCDGFYAAVIERVR